MKCKMKTNKNASGRRHKETKTTVILDTKLVKASTSLLKVTIQGNIEGRSEERKLHGCQI